MEEIDNGEELTSSIDVDTNQLEELGDDLVLDSANTSQDVNKEQQLSDDEICSLHKKFKSVKALAEAYDNLQAEFTKRSQKLKELEKMSDKTEDSVPAFLQDDWMGQVQTFLEVNKDAKDYAAEISDLILKDETIAKSKDPLNTAWQKVAATHFVSKQKMAKDESFLNEFVLSNESVKNQIVRDYLLSMQNKNEAPILITQNSSNQITVSKKPILKTLADAGVAVTKLFNNE